MNWIRAFGDTSKIAVWREMLLGKRPVKDPFDTSGDPETTMKKQLSKFDNRKKRYTERDKEKYMLEKVKEAIDRMRNISVGFEKEIDIGLERERQKEITDKENDEKDLRKMGAVQKNIEKAEKGIEKGIITMKKQAAADRWMITSLKYKNSLLKKENQKLMTPPDIPLPKLPVVKTAPAPGPPVLPPPKLLQSEDPLLLAKKIAASRKTGDNTLKKMTRDNKKKGYSLNELMKISAQFSASRSDKGIDEERKERGEKKIYKDENSLASILERRFENVNAPPEEKKEEEEEQDFGARFELLFKNLYFCSWCGDFAKHKCSQCSNAYYCSSECQTNDWALHEDQCISSASSQISIL